MSGVTDPTQATGGPKKTAEPGTVEDHTVDHTSEEPGLFDVYRVALSAVFCSSYKHHRATCQSSLTRSLSQQVFMDVTMTLQDELTTAAAKGNTAAAEALLNRGAQVNGTNRFGRTALQVSAVSNSPLSPTYTGLIRRGNSKFPNGKRRHKSLLFLLFLQLLAIRDLYMSLIIIVILKKERKKRRV